MPRTNQPKLEEKGPFGYIKRTTKYDVLFSDDGSDKVTYKSWTVYDPVREIGGDIEKNTDLCISARL